MATALFVHGISIRQRGYDLSFQQIESYLKQREPGVVLAPCVWGDIYGAALKAGGASIPQHSVSKGLDDDLGDDEGLGLWQALYSDPLAELRLWTLRPATMEPFDPLGRKTPNQLFDERAQALTASAELAEILRRAGIGEQEFYAARQAVLGSPTYMTALNSTGPEDLSEFSWTLARAIAAATIAPLASPAGAGTIEQAEAGILDADVRDELVTRLAGELWNQAKGLISSWLPWAVSALGTRYLTASRNFFSCAVVPYIGDILLYQGGGKPIRDLIRAQVAACKPPVVLLAHSLGGVACVELLAAEPLPEVELLVTVGSQAPFFYEMDALTSLRFGQSLPDHFPRWLNIYDRCDFLSFIGAPVFGDDKRVEDVEVKNRQPFPWSHTSYWSNSQTWDAILARLPRQQR